MSHRKRTVLIVEDEVIVAMDVAMAFSDAGWSVMGPYGRLEDARGAISSAQPCAAVMDLDLHGESSLPVASELAKKGIRVVLFTGGETRGLPASLAEAAVVSKPADIREVVARCVDRET